MTRNILYMKAVASRPTRRHLFKATAGNKASTSFGVLRKDTGKLSHNQRNNVWGSGGQDGLEGSQMRALLKNIIQRSRGLYSKHKMREGKENRGNIKRGGGGKGKHRH